MNQPRFSPIDPISRYSEILFGLLMVLTFTGCFNALEAGKAEIKDLLIAGIGCNIAWGMIDAIVYLITTLTERARALRLLQQLHNLQPGDNRGIAALRDALPGPLAAICRDDELGDWQSRLRQHPELSQGPIFRWNDLLNSLGVFLMVFLSTFPVLLPFMFLQDPVPALRLSHGIALLMLMLIGRGLARYAGSPRPRLVGVLFAAAGVAIVLATIALGG
ncbi:VIT1/CCC1 transporter family protein [Aeromonas eucrenophila]|uniref:hypothetical protein n=1 Tax=Aeromonas eucrenophila TaxID=649 RepID=UPI0005B229F7|nr:hypothetical protein [Aeromonas eucrenophila]